MATMTTAAPVARKPLYSSLFVQVLVALALGIVIGMASPDFAISLKILSDAFLKLITMIVAPIVFGTMAFLALGLTLSVAAFLILLPAIVIVALLGLFLPY